MEEAGRRRARWEWKRQDEEGRRGKERGRMEKGTEGKEEAGWRRSLRERERQVGGGRVN